MSVPVRLWTKTIDAGPEAMGEFLRKLGDDIELANGDICLISVGVHPSELGAEFWDMQVVVDVESNADPAEEEVCDACEAIVRDIDKHMEWHEQLGQVAASARRADSFTRPLGGL